MDPIVSIIIPIYNGASTIERAIESCIGQTYQNIEILIIDNASTDNTKEVVSSMNEPKVVYVYLDEKGRSLARNIGLKQARGKYIQFLDADDCLLPDKIKKSVEYLENNEPVAAYVCGIDYFVDEEFSHSIFPEYHYKNELLAHNVFPIHAPLFKNESSKVYFKEELDFCEDWLFWVEKLYNKTLHFDKKYRGGVIYIHGNNTMSQIDKMNEFQLYVQQLIKINYPIKTRALFVNEIKLLVIHCFTKEKEPMTVDILNKNTKMLYCLVRLLVAIPVISKIMKNKIAKLEEKSFY